MRQPGIISRKIFVDEELYQQEQEQVFAHAWVFVGHESQIPKPGDYFASCMGEELGRVRPRWRPEARQAERDHTPWRLSRHETSSTYF